MKTIEEVAREYSQQVGDGTGNIELTNVAYDAVLYGAERATRWISVKDELPESESEVSIFSSYLLLKIKDIEFPVVGYFTISRDDSFFELMDTSIKDGVDEVMVTHWRPIELK